MVATRRGTRTSASDSLHTEPADSPDVNTQTSSASVRSTRRTTRRDKETEQQVEESSLPSTNGSQQTKRGRAQSRARKGAGASQDTIVGEPSQVSTRGTVRSRKSRTGDFEQQASSSIKSSTRKRKQQNDAELETAPSTQPQPARSLRRRAPPATDDTDDENRAVSQLQREAEEEVEISQTEDGISGRLNRKAKGSKAEENATGGSTRSKRRTPLSPKTVTQLSTRSRRTRTDAAKEAVEESISTQAKKGLPRKQTSSKAAEPEIEAQDLHDTAPPKTHSRPSKAKKQIDSRPHSPGSDLSMSSRATTPSISPAPQFVQPKDFSEDRADSRDAAEDQEDDSLEALLDHDDRMEEASEDELAGPKTPMRRAAQVKTKVRRGKKTKQKQESLPQIDEGASNAQLSLPTDTEQSLSAVEPIIRHRQTKHQHIDITDENLLDVVPAIVEEAIDDSLFAEDTLFGDIPSEPLQESTPFDLEAIADERLQGNDMMDVDETVLVEDIQNESEEDQTAAGTDPADDQTNANNETPLHGSEHVDDDADDLEYTRLTNNPKTPRPQTINWYHVEPNTVLRDTIDLGLSPNADQSQLGILPDISASSPIKALDQVPPTDHEEVRGDIEDETVEFTEFVSLPSAMQSTPIQQHPVLQTVDAQSVTEQSPLQTEQDKTNQEQRRQETASPDELQSTAGDAEMPHYMLPTVAFDARRKTLPARMIFTPARVDPRPKTSDGSGSAVIDRPDLARSRPSSRIATRRLEGLATPSRPKRVLAPFAVTTPSIVNQRTPIRSAAQANSKTVANTPRAPHTVVGYSRSMLVDSTQRQGHASLTLDKLKRLARNDNKAGVYRSPARTPLRSITGAATATAMTPHPAIPLRGVVAIVEVYTCEGASASAPFVALLHRLGAKTTKIWTDRVTHVIFKDGSPTTLHKIAQHNKRALRTGEGRQVHCVNSRWVSDCDARSTRCIETDDAYAVSTETLTGSAKRKRKSMEPTTMINVDGHLVKDRRASWGRSSSQSRSRSITPVGPERLHGAFSSSKLASSALEGSQGTASPSTPAWLAAPHRLIQSTAPVKRIRKLAPIAGIRFGTSRSVYEQLPSGS